MPIRSFSSSEAIRNLGSNRMSRWPDGRLGNTRLDRLASAASKPSFSFSTTDKLLTIGSCFAREIEKYLSEYGFDVPALAVSIPESERASSTENDLLNKYTVQSMENELRWAFLGNEVPPEDFYLSAGDNKWHDAQLVANLNPASLERVIERRQMVTDLMRLAPICRVVVMTLGLGEAWFDTKTGLYLNAMPPRPAINLEPDRFRLDVLSHDDILASLERIHGLLSQHGHPEFRLLATVSPVPFKATFTGGDALAANTYSKSVQRSAVEHFIQNHKNVDYFPSYEIVTLSNRQLAYELDNIHVTRNAVAHIMNSVMSAYVPGQALKEVDKGLEAKTRQSTAPASKGVLIGQAKEAMAEKNYGAAISAYSNLLFRFGEGMPADEEAMFRLNLGVALLRSKLTQEGVAQLEKANMMVPDQPRATYKLGLGYARLKMNDKALDLFKSAYRMNPLEPDYPWRLGAQLIVMGEVEQGVEYARKALELKPDHIDAREIVSKYSGV